MPTTTCRLDRKINGRTGANCAHHDDLDRCLLDGLRETLDTLTVGVVIVREDGWIVHANLAASQMLEASRPIISAAGWLGAPLPDLTKELRHAIRTAHTARSRDGTDAIGVPLINDDMCAATARVLPLSRRPFHASHPTQANCAVFVASGHAAPGVDIGTVGRVFGLTAAETRLLGHLLAGARLTEAAAAIGITEATAKTHRSHIFSKAGVSRCTDLRTLVSRLVPPILRVQNS